MIRTLACRSRLLLLTVGAISASFGALPSQQRAAARTPVHGGAQGATQPSAAAHQMVATEDYLFVVYDGVLHQFDIQSLKLCNKVRLTTTEEMLAQDANEQRAAAQARVADQLEKAIDDAKPTAKAPSPADMSKVVERALTWLQAHQDKDGRWDADLFMKHDAAGSAVCDGAGSAVHDIGVTGLAVMALLTAGDDYAKEVRRAVGWLHNQQHDNGMFGLNTAHDFIYDHAIATYAMCRTMQVLDRNDALLGPMVQNAINYLESHRNPYSVWRYQPRDNDNDMSVTTWCLLAYAAAKDLGLKVNKGALQLGSTYMDQITGANGHAGYSKQGEASSRMPGQHATKFPTDKGEAMTAAALLCRYELQQTPKTNRVMLASAKLLHSKPPVWDQQAGSIDEYYWFFGTLALRHAGGDAWTDWASHLASLAASQQQKQGNAAGSWDPIGVWGESGGRVFSTAVFAMACHATLPKSE